MKHYIETTEVEDAILTPYAQIQNSTVPALIAANGKAQVIQSAIRHFCSKAARVGAADEAIVAVVLKDENAIFNAVWSDWNAKQSFAGVISASLQADVPVKARAGEKVAA